LSFIEDPPYPFGQDYYDAFHKLLANPYEQADVEAFHPDYLCFGPENPADYEMVVQEEIDELEAVTPWI